MRTKRILVTDGARFIGSYLCGRLVIEGHDMLHPYLADVATGICSLEDYDSMF